MIVAESCYDEMINSVARNIYARVELYEGSTLLDTYTYDGALQSFNIERQGSASKFFGYGICQKITVKLRDKDRLIDIKKGQGIDVAIGVGCEYLYPYPVFYVDEVQRDENTNALTITAYDAIYKTNNYKVSDLVLPENYSILYFMSACAALLGIALRLENLLDSTILFPTYNGGANFDGTETVREALDDIAEVTGMIYYINNDWQLTFKKLDKSGDPVLTIDKSKYFTLSAKTPYNLEAITHATELGDNITVKTNVEGSHQYLRENAFISNRDDAHILLQNAFNNVSGLTIHQFDCKWRGNFLLEIGDKIALVTKDDTIIHSYLLNDTITYNGGLVGSTSWSYTDNEGETASNPATLGDALNDTIARVDKVNKEIILLVKDTDDMKSTINSIKIDTNGIALRAESIYDELSSQITLSANEIRSEVSDGINDVRSTITQTANGIRSEVADDINGLNTKIEQNKNSISTIVSDQEDYSEFKQTLEGFSFMNKGGTVKISGGDINLTGAITFNNLDTATQNKINDAVSDSSDAISTVAGWAHSDNGTYIDGDMIYSDSIYADSIHLGGWMNVYKTTKGSTVGGYIGYDSGFNSTYGIGMQAYNSSAQCVCTNQAARLSWGSTSTFVADSNGNAYVGGDSIIFEIEDSPYVGLYDHTTYGSLRPCETDTTMHLGNASFKWDSLYAKNGTIQTSDQNLKYDIENVPDRYVTLFDNLTPRRFKMVEGTSGRYHVGYVAQEVEAAMNTAGVSSQEFAGFIKDKDADGNDVYMLRYGEFDAIRDAKIKQLESELNALKADNEDLKARIERLEQLL